MEPTTHLDDSRIASFTDRVQGPVLMSADEGYDEARTVWNGLIDKEPAVIVRCTGTADVIEAVTLARESKLPLAVKGGGHGMTGHAVCDDGIVIDLSPMDAVRVDPNERTVRVHGGATWEQVNHEALPLGLVPPGIPMDVGVAGFTLGGGMGILSRTHGLASDLLREVDVVTADGDFLTASEDDRANLFWALRGAGANMGIATSFVFDCVPMATEYATVELHYPLDLAPEVLRTYRDAMREARDELFSGVSFVVAPEDPDFPPDVRGDTVLSVGLTYLGPRGDAHEVFEPFLEVEDPIAKSTEVTPYTDLYSYFPAEAGERNHWKSLYLDGLSGDLFETLVERTAPLPTPATIVSIYGLGGAMSRYESDATAYAHRDASYLIHIATRWSDPAEDDACIGWSRELHEALVPYGTGGEYINNQTDDDPDRVRAAYGDHYDRLVEIKDKWDPDNLFSVNQNIEPTR